MNEIEQQQPDAGSIESQRGDRVPPTREWDRVPFDDIDGAGMSYVDAH